MSTTSSLPAATQVGSVTLDFRSFAICMIIFPTIAVVLRFWSRALTRGANGIRFWWDDWTVLAALVLSVVASAIHLNLLALGMGQHVKQLPLANTSEIFKELWVSYFMSDLGLAMSKASVLFFYTRVFTMQTRWFRYGIWLAHALNIGWWLSAIVRCVLFCSPVQKYWEFSLPGFCRSSTSLYIGSAVPSVAIDLLILVLPIPLMAKLSLKLSRKLLIIAIFLCGYLVIGVSCGRLAWSLVNSQALAEDATFNIVPLAFLVDAELPLSIIGCSFPTLFFLVRRAMAHGAASLFSAKTPSTNRSYQLKSNRSYQLKGSLQSPSHRRLHSTDNSVDMDDKALDVKVSSHSVSGDSIGKGEAL